MNLMADRISFTPFPSLTTKRLILRQMKLADENEVFALHSDKKNRQYLVTPLAKSIEDTRKFIQKISDGINNYTTLYLCQAIWAVLIRLGVFAIIAPPTLVALEIGNPLIDDPFRQPFSIEVAIQLYSSNARNVENLVTCEIHQSP